MTTTELYPTVPLTSLANCSRQAPRRGLPGISPQIHPGLYPVLLLSSFNSSISFQSLYFLSPNKELPISLLTKKKKGKKKSPLLTTFSVQIVLDSENIP